VVVVVVVVVVIVKVSWFDGTPIVGRKKGDERRKEGR
jgi:hypothetical protein